MEEMKKQTLTEEELENINGGTGDGEVPPSWKPATVIEQGDYFPLCPDDNIVMDQDGWVVAFARWQFHCSKCRKRYAKTADGRWFTPASKFL